MCWCRKVSFAYFEFNISELDFDSIQTFWNWNNPTYRSFIVELCSPRLVSNRAANVCILHCQEIQQKIYSSNLLHKFYKLKIILSKQAFTVIFCLVAAIFKVQNSLASFDMFSGIVFINDFSTFVANGWLAKLELHFQHLQWLFFRTLKCWISIFEWKLKFLNDRLKNTYE